MAQSTERRGARRDRAKALWRNMRRTARRQQRISFTDLWRTINDDQFAKQKHHAAKARKEAVRAHLQTAA